MTRGFLAQFRQGSKTKESFSGDELGYLEGKSSVEGPPSQRIYSRLYWKVSPFPLLSPLDLTFFLPLLAFR
jgi:hypothetical protein